MAKESAENQFTMKWKGNKTPTGATIGGIPIGYMRDGAIYGSSGQLGTYARTEEFGGPGKDEHTILILTHHTSATPPPGGEITFSQINSAGITKG